MLIIVCPKCKSHKTFLNKEGDPPAWFICKECNHEFDQGHYEEAKALSYVIRVRGITDEQMEVSVGDITFTCEEWLFENRTLLINMLQQCKGQFSKEEAELITDELHAINQPLYL